MSRVAGKTGRTRVRVYRSVEELPEVLEPGRYVVEGEALEVMEPVGRGTVEELLRLLRERPGHRFI